MFGIILGLFFILGMIIGTAFRARQAYQLEGWSWKTFTNIWSTWFHLVMLPWNLMMTTYPDPDKDPHHHNHRRLFGGED
jgi:hypothetical protein